MTGIFHIRTQRGLVAAVWARLRTPHGLVQVAAGLVGQDEGGVVDKGAGYAYSLLLPAGQLPWKMVQGVPHAHPLQGQARFIGRLW